MATQEFTSEELASEIWKPVIGYETMYAVSNLGRVKRSRDSQKQTNKILKGAINEDGYHRIILGRAKGHPPRRNIFVHKLVAAAFIGPVPVGHQTNHIDRIRNNNRATNLEYLTFLQNVQHSIEQLRAANPRGVNHGNAKINDDTVRAIRKMRLTGASYTQIGLAFNVDRMTAFYIIHGKQWKHVSD